MKELGAFLSQYIATEASNVMVFEYHGKEIFYYFDTEIWEIPRCLEDKLAEKCYNFYEESIEWID